MSKKGKIQGILVAIFTFIMLLVAAVILNGSGTQFSILSPKAQYSAVDVDIDRQVLQVNEDTVQVTMDWMASIEDRDYYGNEFIWIFRNDKFYSSKGWVNLRDKTHQESFTIAGLEPGWNKIEVMVGLHGYWSMGSSCQSTHSVYCNEKRYVDTFMCRGQVELMNDMSCDLITKLYGSEGAEHASPERLEDYQADYSGQIRDVVIKTWTFNVYREKVAEIPVQPVVTPVDTPVDAPDDPIVEPAPGELLCRHKWLNICWDWLTNLFS